MFSPFLTKFVCLQAIFRTSCVHRCYGDNVQFTTHTTPTVTTTDPVISITNTDAHFDGNVTSGGGGTITERGFCIGANANPTTAGTKYIVAGTTGAYNYIATDLTGNTHYHIRAQLMTLARAMELMSHLLPPHFLMQRVLALKLMGL